MSDEEKPLILKDWHKPEQAVEVNGKQGVIFQIADQEESGKKYVVAMDIQHEDGTHTFTNGKNVKQKQP